MKWTVLLLVCLALPATAAVYKWVDENGEVHYGDTPPPGGEARQVDLPDYSRYAPRPLDSRPGEAASARAPEAPAREATGPASYEVLRITRPEPNGTVRGSDGQLNVQLAIVPALGEDHYVSFTLDGRALSTRLRGTAFDLNGVDRGQHTLQARIVDADGRQLASSDPVTFTMRKDSLLMPGRQPPSGEVPPPGPIPSTPGQTNPAFKPNYGG